jgi:hypothetical protein
MAMKRRPGERLTPAEAVAARAASAARWEVRWSDYRGFHDYVGRRPPKSGGPKKLRRKPPPPVQRHRFNTREGAVEFVARLRAAIPLDELVVQIIDRRGPKSPLPAATPLFPGDWPLQHRS